MGRRLPAALPVFGSSDVGAIRVAQCDPKETVRESAL
jgi:hypothetical protein